MSDQK